MNRFFINRQSDFASEETAGRFSRRRSGLQELEAEMGADVGRTRFAKVNRDLWGPPPPTSNKKRGFKGGS